MSGMIRRVVCGLTAACLAVGSAPMAALAHDFERPGGTSPDEPPEPHTPPPCSNNPSGEDCNVGRTTDPIHVDRGEFFLAPTDLAIPGRGLSIRFARSYRSRSAYNGPLGYGWDFSYNRRLRMLANGNVVLLSGANRHDEFISVGGIYGTPPGLFVRLVKNGDGTWMLSSAHGELHQFDVDGKLTAITDRNGNSLNFGYDPAGKLPITGPSEFFVSQTTAVIARDFRLTTITDPAGRQVTLGYNADGRLVSVTDWTGRAWTYGYDGQGNLASVTAPPTPGFPSGTTTTYAYDADHRLLSVTDPKGQISVTNVYSARRIASQTYGGGTAMFAYDDANQQTSGVDRNGTSWRWTFDADGHIITEEIFTKGLRPGDPPVYVTTHTYDSDGLRTGTSFPAGNSIQWTYASGLGVGEIVDRRKRRNLLEIRQKAPMGSPAPDLVTSFTYEPEYNLVKTMTDPLGRVTTYTYDYELGEPMTGNLRQITAPSVSGQTIQTLITYNAFGQPETVTDPTGIVTKYVYGGATGYLTQVVEGFGTALAGTTQLGRDALGRVTSVTDPRGNATTLAYDALNRLTQLTAPAPLGFQTHVVYDANGNLAQVDRQATGAAPGPRPPAGSVDPADDWQTTLYSYTAVNEPASITDDLGHATSFTYDALGNRLTVTDAKGQVTASLYDERSLLMRVIDAATPAGETAYAYDANGNLASVTDANGRVTSHAYDGFDRLAGMTYPDGSFESYAYDAASNLTGRTVPDGQTISYAYDALNRLATKTLPGAEVWSYTYDQAGRLKSAANPTGTISHFYDGRGRLAQAVYPGGKVFTYAYDAAGNRTGLTYAGGPTVGYAYDALNRLSAITDLNGQTVGFLYDALSRRTSLTLPNGVASGYAYDAADRLTGLTTSAGPATLSSSAYTYDALGNRLSQTVQPGSVASAFAYDPLSQLVSSTNPAVSYAYDAVGNRTTAEGEAYVTNTLNQYTSVDGTALAYDANGNLVSDGARSAAYDAENRLLSLSGGGTSATYAYDALGRRASKTVGGVATQYLYDGLDLVAETDAAGAITARYLFGPGIDQPLEMKRGGATHYYSADGLGSVAHLTDATGAVVERYAYDPFGAPAITDAVGTVLAASALGNPFLFTAREWDPDTQLYYYRARYYSPDLGRFLSRDPLGLVADINAYRYVGNNPINFFDPRGLDWGGGSDPDDIFPGSYSEISWDPSFVPPPAPTTYSDLDWVLNPDYSWLAPPDEPSGVPGMRADSPSERMGRYQAAAKEWLKRASLIRCFFPNDEKAFQDALNNAREHLEMMRESLEDIQAEQARYFADSLYEEFMDGYDELLELNRQLNSPGPWSEAIREAGRTRYRAPGGR